MGISPQTAHAYVTEALEKGMAEIHERGRAYVFTELARLEQPVAFLQRAIRRGDTDAIREHRSLSESRRKLLGLDAQPDSDTGAREIIVTLQLPQDPALARREAPADVGATNTDDRRPSPVSVDRDRNENR
jgi:hypothetical protein